jgi:hypothetical protein
MLARLSDANPDPRAVDRQDIFFSEVVQSCRQPS